MNEAIIEALREAWKCTPDMSFVELIDSITVQPLIELEEEEILEEINNFILQNQ